MRKLGGVRTEETNSPCIHTRARRRTCVRIMIIRRRGIIKTRNAILRRPRRFQGSLFKNQPPLRPERATPFSRAAQPSLTAAERSRPPDHPPRWKPSCARAPPSTAACGSRDSLRRRVIARSPARVEDVRQEEGLAGATDKIGFANSDSIREVLRVSPLRPLAPVRFLGNTLVQ